jgi:hypothetical protein
MAAADYILPLSIGLKQKLSARIKELLLTKVDKFILHFIARASPYRQQVPILQGSASTSWQWRWGSV